jgi:hypothetical protein
MELDDRSVLEGERILPSNMADAEQTNIQPQDEFDETNNMFSVLS